MNQTHVMTNLPTSAGRREWRPDAADEHLVSLVDPTSFEADRYRTLRHVVEGIHGTKQVIAVTSAVAGDGKTTTAINLAGTLAHGQKARILLVDLDLRTRSLESRLGLTAHGPGLVDLVLNPDLALDDAVRRHPQFRLSVLPAGRAMKVTYELLKSPRLGEILHEARQQYDHIVLDTPPLVPVPDSRLVADHVDGFVMIVAAHRTPRKLFEDALNVMDPAKLIGIVFNGDDRQHSGYYGAYYGDSNGRGARGRWTSLLDLALRPFQSWLGRPNE